VHASTAIFLSLTFQYTNVYMSLFTPLTHCIWTGPSGKLPFECQIIANKKKNCQKFLLKKKRQFLAIFLRFKWQFSWGSELDIGYNDIQWKLYRYQSKCDELILTHKAVAHIYTLDCRTVYFSSMLIVYSTSVTTNRLDINRTQVDEDKGRKQDLE